MPRSCKKSVDKIYEAVKDLKLIDDNGRMMKLSNDIWQEASLRLNNEMSYKYLYLYISQNRYGIADKLHEKYGVKAELVNESEKALNNTNSSNWSMNDSLLPLPSLRTTITLSLDAWNKILPHDVTYNERTYVVLKEGWTDILYDQIWKELKLPCCFSFKNAKCYSEAGEIYLKIKGKCSECNNKINAYNMTGSTENGLELHISTHDTKGVAHEKKRQLRGIKRKNVVKEINATSTYAWRREEANKIMDFGDIEPANLYNENVLRKAKQLQNDKELGLGKVSDPIASVRELKYSAEFAGSIKEIGFDSFFVMYWSPEQIHMYKQFVKHNFPSTNCLSIDATGSIIKKLKKPDGTKNVIFLYQAVVPFEGKILPLFQMVSEKHDANMITFWLREWLRTNVPCPSNVVIDYSIALLNAVTLAFNNIKVSEYVNNCIGILEGENNEISKPKCIIRIDIAHFIKFICRWKCFNGKPPQVKDFYVRCMGLLSKCSNLDTFVRMSDDILLVAASETENIDAKYDEPDCYMAQKRLINLIKNDKEIYSSAEENADCTEENEDIEYVCENRIEIILEHMRSISTHCGLDNSFSNRPNPYWCPEFISNFINIAKHFPLWTNVMSGHLNSVPSSACSEEYFRELKQIVLKNKKCEN